MTPPPLAASPAARWLHGHDPASWPLDAPSLTRALAAAATTDPAGAGAVWAALGRGGDAGAIATVAGLLAALRWSRDAMAALDGLVACVAGANVTNHQPAGAAVAAVAALRAAGAPADALAAVVAFAVPTAVTSYLSTVSGATEAASPDAALAAAPPPPPLSTLTAAWPAAATLLIDDWVALERATAATRGLAAWASGGAASLTTFALPWTHWADAREHVASCLLPLLEGGDGADGVAVLLSPPASAAAALTASVATAAAARAAAAGAPPPSVAIISDDDDLLMSVSVALCEGGVTHAAVAGSVHDAGALAAAAAAAGAPPLHRCAWLLSLTDCGDGDVAARAAAIAPFLGDAGAVTLDATGPSNRPAAPTALPRAHLAPARAALAAASGRAAPSPSSAVADAASAGLVPRPAAGARVARGGVACAVGHVDALPLRLTRRSGDDDHRVARLLTAWTGRSNDAATSVPPPITTTWLATVGDDDWPVAALSLTRPTPTTLHLTCASVDPATEAAVATDIALCLLSTLAFDALCDDGVACVTADAAAPLLPPLLSNTPLLTLDAWVGRRAEGERRARLPAGVDLAGLARCMVGGRLVEGGGADDGDDAPARPPPPADPPSSAPSTTTPDAATLDRFIAVIIAEATAVIAAQRGAAASATAAPLLTPTTSFTAAGLDSLDMVRAASALTTALGVSLPPIALFDHPTPAALAAVAAAAPRRSGAAPLPPRRATLADVVAGDDGRPGLATVLARRSSVTSVVPVTLTAQPAAAPPVFICGITLRAAAARADALVRTPRAAAALAADAPNPIPMVRWDVDAAAGTTGARFAATLRGVTAFDGAAFGLTPADAAAADPQQRLMLEAAADLLAGLRDALPTSRRLPVSVVVGVSYSDAVTLASRRDTAARRGPSPLAAAAGAPSVVPGRVAFTFDLAGDAAAVDTACSSALVAVAVAARGVRTPTSPPAALAGAVCLLLADRTHASYAAAGMLTPDGRCKALDVAADGYGRADAVGALALAVGAGVAAGPADAVADAWRTAPGRALLAAAVVNQDGRSASLTAPSGPAQGELVAAAARAAATPLTALALHGTGTPLGDPIEVGAATSVLLSGSAATSSATPLLLAAPKAGAAHAEPAAGCVSAAALRVSATAAAHPVAHLRSMNPYVTAALSSASRRVSVPRTDSGAPRAGGAVGASAFAFQGTNAHIVLAAGQGEVVGADTSPLMIHKQRCWPAPPARALVGASARAADGGVMFAPAHAVRLEVATGDASTLALEAALAAAHTVAWPATPALARVVVGSVGGSAPPSVTVSHGRVVAGSLSADIVAVGKVSGGTHRLVCALVKAFTRCQPPAAAVAAIAPPHAPSGDGAYVAHPATLASVLALGGQGRRLKTASIIRCAVTRGRGAGWSVWRGKHGGSARVCVRGAAFGGPVLTSPPLPPTSVRLYGCQWRVTQPGAFGGRLAPRGAPTAARAVAAVLAALQGAAFSRRPVRLVTVGVASTSYPCRPPVGTPAAARVLAAARCAVAESRAVSVVASDGDGWAVMAAATALPGAPFGAGTAGGTWVDPVLCDGGATRRRTATLPPATSIVTGGTGGIGSLIALWLARRGARAVVAVGRRARGDTAACGALVALCRCDRDGRRRCLRS